MKKSLLFMICIVPALMMLGGCGKAAPVSTETPAPEETPAPAAVILPNPVHETDEAGLLEATGLTLPTPEGAENVHRSYIDMAGEAPIAQLAFTIGDKAATLRAQANGAVRPADISGLYYDWTESGTAQVGYCDAELHTNGAAGYIAWADAAPGILYNLSMTEGADAETLTDLANAAFFPLQGDADGDEQPDERYLPYRELIETIAENIRGGWQTAKPGELGLSDVFSREGHEAIGWVQLDINGDGTDELLFGEDGADGAAGPFYDLYTILDGSLAHPVCGGEFSRWYVTEGGILVNAVSSGGPDWYRTAYGYFNGMLVEGFNAGTSEYLNLHFAPFGAEE